MALKSRAFVLFALLLTVLTPAAGAATESPRPLLVTVDDLPVAGGSLHRDPEDRESITRGLLKVLAAHEISAVALVTWSNVRGPDDLRLLEMWLDAGHELGNHSRAHRSYTTTEAETYVADIEAGRRGSCRPGFRNSAPLRRSARLQPLGSPRQRAAVGSGAQRNRVADGSPGAGVESG